MRLHQRKAFTLIELLVVVAIIAILIGLALPAIQKVRAASARMQCANNLKQIGLALHLYHDSRGTFPPGCSYQNGTDPQPHMTWMTRLLPYLEQEALWRQAEEAFQQEKFFEKPPHLPILGTALRAFACPADGRTLQPKVFRPFKVGLTSYLGVEGRDQTKRDGVLYLDSQTRLADIADGTSSTLAVGERPPNADEHLGWWYAGWGQSMDGSADNVLGVRELNVHKSYRACSPGPYHFTLGNLRNNCDAFHFWSLHSGGAHFLYADGSAHFLSYSADPLLPALATRAGGEPAELP